MNTIKPRNVISRLSASHWISVGTRLTRPGGDASGAPLYQSEHAVLYRYDGSAAASVQVLLTVWPDKTGLRDLLSQVKGPAVTGCAGASFRLGAGWKLLPENAGSHSN